MNNHTLKKLGVPQECLGEAIAGVQSLSKYNRTVDKPLRRDVQDAVAAVAANPDAHTACEYFGTLAAAMIRERDFVRPEPAPYKVWGADGIDEGTHAQMKAACSLPNAVAGALMPDGHIAWSLPCGGVLALDNAVAPYAVGVDIACRMKLTVYPVSPEEFEKRRSAFREALLGGTVFGIGPAGNQPVRQEHPVMDDDWACTNTTKTLKDRAWQQLGTSGSGNHFVEWGILEKFGPSVDSGPLERAGLPPGRYVALMSHSGSRGPGSVVCKVYSDIALGRLPRRYADVGKLAWLDMDTEAGQEYWAAMNLMGRYAAANHDIIHRRVAELAGVQAVSVVENWHNYAWIEDHNGRQLYVHRKGATPAGKGVMGVIPGSMGTPAFVVEGLGNPDSLCSASHGAGRLMSRTKAREKYDANAGFGDLAKKGLEVLGAGADEVPGVYKDIHAVMAAQADLVRITARFDPQIVRMCGDDSPAED